MPKGLLNAVNSPYQHNLPLLASISVGTETANTINVSITLKDQKGQALGEKAAVEAYLSDVSTGLGVTATGPGGGWAIGTNGALIPRVTSKSALLVCNTAGLVDITLTETGTPTWYLVIILANGRPVISGAITFA
jgi:hypothetical protein